MTVRLTEEGCWSLLSTASVARLAVVDHAGPRTIPIGIRVQGRSIYLRPAPDSRLDRLHDHASISLEVAGERGGRTWSIVVLGSAVADEQDDQVRIEPKIVSGRSLA